jgi:hypothetical protein
VSNQPNKKAKQESPYSTRLERPEIRCGMSSFGVHALCYHLDRDVRRDRQAERLHGSYKTAHQITQWPQREAKEDTLELGEIRRPEARHGVPTRRRLYKTKPKEIKQPSATIKSDDNKKMRNQNAH